MTYYIIYKITNLITKEEYIGRHKCKKLNDGYMGSGSKIKENIIKYGKENFKKEILFIFDNKIDMVNKEQELVNKKYISLQNTLNVIIGGPEYDVSDTVVVKHIGKNEKYFRINKNKYDKTIYETPTSNTLLVLDNVGISRITSDEYQKNKKYYNTPSTGYVSVIDKETNKTLRIKCTDFDENRYIKVFGRCPIVELNGKRKYVEREYFDKNNLHGIHKNKVTVIEKSTGKCIHVLKEEYKNNKHLYDHITKGYTTGKHRVTGDKIRIKSKDIEKYRKDYIFSSHGYITVYHIKDEKFINIKKELYNNKEYKLAQDKMFICFNKDGSKRFKYWGNKKDFFNKYKIHYKIWEAIIKEESVPDTIRKNKEYIGCYFKLFNWKEFDNVQEMWKSM